MDYSKYKNELEYPAMPKKPVTPKTTHPQAFIDHAEELKSYATQLEEFQSKKASWQTNEVNRWELFRLDALDEVGLTGHILADKAYSYAYEQGHYAGMSEVFSKLNRMAEMILGDGHNAPAPINPMRERMLLRLNMIRKENNYFLNSTMRWKDARYGEVHLSNVNFDELTDADLLDIYEMIIRRLYVQM
jgi:hypothetical protein